MPAEPWADFWQALGLVLRRFVDVGLSESSTDFEVWNVCQSEQLILITDNRNLDSEDSLKATIRRNNTPASLPDFRHRGHEGVPNGQLLRGARGRGTFRLPPADRRRSRYGAAISPLKPDWALARVLVTWSTGVSWLLQAMKRWYNTRHVFSHLEYPSIQNN